MCYTFIHSKLLDEVSRTAGTNSTGIGSQNGNGRSMYFEFYLYDITLYKYVL